MTLKQLEAFYWAASCANFAMAAHRLHISISTLSKRILELERSLDLQLFDRTRLKATLTAAGSRLLPQARMLLEAAAAVRKSAGSGSGLAGRVRIGVGELSALTWLPRFLAQVRKSHPGLHIEATSAVGAVLEEALLRGTLDCAVIAGRSSRSMILSQPVAEARFVWMAKASVAGRTRRIGQDLLQRNPLVTMPTSAGSSRLLDDWLLASGFNAGERMTCSNWGAVAGMLIEGIGIGYLPSGWAQAFVRRRQLVKLESSAPLPPLPYSIQWRRDENRELVAAVCGLLGTSVNFTDATPLF